MTAPVDRHQVAAWIFAATALLGALLLHLLPALLAGLLVFELVHRLAARLPNGLGERRKTLALLLFAVIVVLAVGAALIGALAFFR